MASCAGELQWNVLIAATLAISAFVMVDSGSSDSGDGGIPLVGVVRISDLGLLKYAFIDVYH